MKVGIIRCQQTEIYCPATSCISVAVNGEGSFAESGPAEIIGINNRDLNTFATDINTTRRLCSLIPPERTVVSESGITCRSDVEKLMEWGVNAVLVGEAIITARDIPAKIRDLMQ